ncbi:MAG: sensor domain-containing diguanylate cyclase, partial [Ruminiclostridium sp.]|nr:sensor domain-containing diguanylate cyclase [Ruminiclostridium sp.]
DRIVIPDNTGLVGKALNDECVVVTNDPYNNPYFNSDVDKKTGYVTKSILVMPIADVNGEYIGALQVINKLDGEFDAKRDVRCLSLAAIICGITLESETFLERSLHDKLTKLKNRMGFHSDYAAKYSKVLEQGRPVCMFICDIDKFKRVNDTYGHNAGDAVLSLMASLLAGACEPEECVYRWGGEEFIMMMPDTELDRCVEKTEKLREKVMNSPCTFGNDVIEFTASFGCRKLDPSISVGENISKADENLYTAKNTGRNKVVY